MRITIIGSIAFAKDMVELYRKLEGMGHNPQMIGYMFGIADGSAAELISEAQGDHAGTKRKYDFIRKWHSLIKSGDAVLVCNLDKNSIRNYIGGNTLMEIGFAHVNGKKVFLLNPVPEEVSYVDEIKAMVDVVIDGDLGRIG